MCEDGGLIGYGMAPAVDIVPVVERSHARLPAVLWAGHVFGQGRGSCRRSPGSCSGRCPAAPRLAVRIR